MTQPLCASFILTAAPPSSCRKYPGGWPFRAGGRAPNSGATTPKQTHQGGARLVHGWCTHITPLFSQFLTKGLLHGNL